MQKEWRNDLIRRSRYYQSLIDSSLLEPGTISFNALNDTCIIMITPFDLFGLDKYCYTFRYCCMEDQSLTLEDGATRIFLNTRGKNDQEVREELVHFLHYIEHTDDASAACSGSENIQVIHECVKKIKASEEAGVKYMQAWEEKILEREKGRSEGLEQGIEQGRSEGLELGRIKGLEQGIQAFILDNLEENVPRERILSKLMKRFALTDVQAEAYYLKYSAR